MPPTPEPLTICGARGRRTAWRLLRAAAAGATTVVLAGCTAEVSSVVGLTVDDQGRVTAAIAVCDGTVDGLVLRDGSGAGEPDELHRWSVEAARGLTLVPLAEDGSRDLATQLGVADDHEVSLDGFGGEHRGANRWFGPGPSFTAGDLAVLPPGEVLWQPFDELTTTGTREFEDAACTYLGAEAGLPGAHR